LCTSLYAGRQKDELIRKAADGLCRHLTRQFTGKRPSDRDLRDLTELGAAIADGHGELTAGIEPPPILMPYRPSCAKVGPVANPPTGPFHALPLRTYIHPHRLRSLRRCSAGISQEPVVRRVGA